VGTKTFSFILLFVLTLSAIAQERIISLSPSITEIIFALDKGDELVGTSTYSLYPKEAQKLPIVGGYTKPNLEKILALSPSLVVGQTFNIGTLQKLKKFHIKTLMLKLKSINDIKNSIELLSKQLNSNKYIQLNQTIDNAIKNIQKTKKQKRIMIVYGLRDDLRSRTYIAGNNIFFDEIIKLTGNTNAYSSNNTTQPVLSYENIIALNPDQVIILHSKKSHPNTDVKKALQSWYALPMNASKNKKISVVDEEYIHIPSHRIALTIKRLAKEMSDD